MKNGDIVKVHDSIELVNYANEKEVCILNDSSYKRSLFDRKDVKLATLEEKIDFLVRKELLND